MATAVAGGVLAAAIGVSGVDIPQVRGDQLFFFYDARAYEAPTEGNDTRTTFVSLLNPADESVLVEVVAYPPNLAAPIVTETIPLVPGRKTILNLPERYAEEYPGILTAGLLVVTPVRGLDDAQPVVPPSELAGSFTIAGPYNGFGENAFARSMVGVRRAGDAVDGVRVRYDTIRPANRVLMIPSHYDLSTLSPPDEDGNRVVLVAFEDLYEATGFRIAAPSPALEVMPTLCGDAGAVEPGALSVEGVLLTDLQTIGGDATPEASGSVFFAFDDLRPALNFFGIFSQALKHLGAGHRLPAAGGVPPCPTPTPTVVEPPPPATPVCGNRIVEEGEQCDGQGATCFEVVGGKRDVCPGAATCVDCRYDLAACQPCPCAADKDCNLDVLCESVRPGCGSLGGVCDDEMCLTAVPQGAELERICGAPLHENRRVLRCP